MTQIQRESSGSEKAQYAYDDSTGRVTKITYGTGARAEYDFDASGALTQLRHYANGGTLIGSVAYEYGNAGNVTKATLDDSLTYNGDEKMGALHYFPRSRGTVERHFWPIRDSEIA